MSIYETSITNPKKQIEFYKDLSEQLEKENQELKLELSGYRQAILNNKEMLGLKEQNKELKKKYENAVADYETTMVEKNKLKKQLEQYKGSHYCSFIDICKSTKIANYNQQKEFINYLEDKIKHFKDIEQYAIKIFDNKAVINLDLVKRSIEEDNLLICSFEEILQKYKEIIGVSDENNIK